MSKKSKFKLIAPIRPEKVEWQEWAKEMILDKYKPLEEGDFIESGGFKLEFQHKKGNKYAFQVWRREDELEVTL